MSEEAPPRIWIDDEMFDYVRHRAGDLDIEYILATEAALATAALRAEIDEYVEREQGLRALLKKEVDDGRAEIDDIGFDAWLEQTLAPKQPETPGE